MRYYIVAFFLIFVACSSQEQNPLFTSSEEEFKEENAWKISSDFNPDNLASSGKRFQLWLRGVVPKSIL